jgi:hypothetical protein
MPEDPPAGALTGPDDADPPKPSPIDGAPTTPYVWPSAPVPPARRRRGGRMVFLTSGLLVGLLALAVVPLVINGGGDGGSPGGTPSTGTLEPAAASPEEYQSALTALDSALASGLRKVGAARTPATVRNAADALALTVRAETDKLREITPPEQVADAHTQLVTALEGFSDAISAGSTEAVCAGSSATSWMSRQTATNQLRAAARALAAADPARAYTVGASLPKAGKDLNRRLGNGRYLKRTMSNGAGQLRIKNGGSADGVIGVVPAKAKRPAIMVYVRGKQSFTVRGVRDGTYQIYMSTGQDWDAKAKTFSRGCSFNRFDNSLTFTTTSTAYTIWEITVQAVSGGNATATGVSPDDFPVG